MGSVSITHKCMDSKPIMLGLWVLYFGVTVVWFHSYHTWYFMGSVSITHNCMGLMPITLVGLWVHCFGVIIFWDLNHFVGSVSFALTILWFLCHCLYLVISDHVHLSGVISHTFACGLAVFRFPRDVSIASDSYYSLGIWT
jgi:hypothetical protein